MLAPWMRTWDHNYFIDAVPVLASWTSNEFVRGAVTGIGVITAIAGIREMAGAFFARASTDDPEKKIVAP